MAIFFNKIRNTYITPLRRFYILIVMYLVIIVGMLTVPLFKINRIFSQLEPFNDNTPIISKMSESAGFFSMLFFTLNHYIYCKSNGINFKIDTSNWLYTYKDGWTDYFLPVELFYYESTIPTKEYSHNEVLDNYSIRDYKEAINDVYRYNSRTIQQIQVIKEKLELPNKYDAIYIRRGDKLADESKLILGSKYIDILLTVSPQCSDLFVQTDDYNCIEELQTYIDNNDLSIRIYTLCKPSEFGVIVNDNRKEELQRATKNNETNKTYISNIIQNLNSTTSVDKMNNEEKYDHFITIITGIEILKRSQYCILDYQSNVSRFIKLVHLQPDNVIDVQNPHKDIDYTKKICPAYSF